jgi:hypothetical protein
MTRRSSTRPMPSSFARMFRNAYGVATRVAPPSQHSAIRAHKRDHQSVVLIVCTNTVQGPHGRLILGSPSRRSQPPSPKADCADFGGGQAPPSLIGMVLCVPDERSARFALRPAAAGVGAAGRPPGRQGRPSRTARESQITFDFAKAWRIGPGVAGAEGVRRRPMRHGKNDPSRVGRP